MNYGYKSLGKKADKVLAKRLTNLVSNLPGLGTCGPYIEINRLYQGVRIRKLTELTKDQLDTFIKQADEIYDSVAFQTR